MTPTELARQMDEVVATHRLLDHPFYQAWAAGTLTRADLAFYATQYWRQVEAFPGYLDALAERLPDDRARAIIEANLRDEIDGEHPRLWLDFAEALGVSPDEVAATPPERETERCVESFSEAARSQSKAFALGMLYGYESQTPEVAETKVKGLRDHYGIDGAGVTYFELHGELDVEHAGELAEAASTLVQEDVNQLLAGARAGAAAIYGLLDGVARARGIE